MRQEPDIDTLREQVRIDRLRLADELYEEAYGSIAREVRTLYARKLAGLPVQESKRTRMARVRRMAAALVDRNAHKEVPKCKIASKK